MQEVYDYTHIYDDKHPIRRQPSAYRTKKNAVVVTWLYYL